MQGEMEGQYCLKWSNHHSNMLNAFGNLLNNEVLCDVTVVCEGQSLKAHRLILSASSTFFHKIFLDNPCANPIIIISDLKYSDVRTLVDFMYNGHVSISENQLSSILKAAENLKIKGLGDHVEHSESGVNHSSSSKSTPYSKESSDYHKYDGMYSSQPEEGRTFAYEHQSEANLTSNSSEVEKAVVPIKDTNYDSHLASSPGHMEIMPSNLLEQSMTTEDMCSEKLFHKDHNSNESSEITSEEKIVTPVAVSTNLPTSIEDTTKKDLSLEEGFQCSSKDLKEEAKNTDETIYSFKHEFMEDTDQSCGSGQESCSVMAESFSDTTMHFSPGNLMSFNSYDCLSENSKRGRKPGSRLCVLCKRVFHSESELEMHMNDHRSGSVLTDSDGRTLPDPMESSPSQTTIDKTLLKLPTMCSTCKYMMNTLNDAQNHITTNPNCRTSQFQCHVCPKTFIWPATLVKHFREQHEGPDGITRVSRRLWFFCDVCKKPLLSKHALGLHKKKFHGLTVQPYSLGSPGDIANCKRGRKRGTRVCGTCKRTFPENEYLLHIQNVHKISMGLSDSSVGTPPFGNESLSSVDNESNSAQSTI